MESINRAIIINCGLGNWYPHGSRRLAKSLNFVGWAGETLIYDGVEPPDNRPHEEYPYYMKIATFEEAIRMGFSHILWVDSSFWSVSNPVKMFDIINDQGYWFFSSGYNLAQSVNDYALAYVGLHRDDAASVTEWASGCVGFNMENPDGAALYYKWKEYMDAGLSVGSRIKNKEESQDPRFIHHRQDQSCLSLAAWKLGLTNTKGLDMVSYRGTGYNEKELIFFIESL
jgi:hypothetical protein